MFFRYQDFLVAAMNANGCDCMPTSTILVLKKCQLSSVDSTNTDSTKAIRLSTKLKPNRGERKE